MKRLLAFALVLGLTLVPGAAAKAPPGGFRVCGPATCLAFTQDDAEQLAINLFYGAASTLDALPPPSAYYAFHWSWQQSGPEYTAYYVPAVGAAYIQASGVSGSLAHGWLALDPNARAALTRVTSSLASFPTATPVRVVVGQKGVADPAGYASLWSLGKRAPSSPPPARGGSAFGSGRRRPARGPAACGSRGARRS